MKDKIESMNRPTVGVLVTLIAACCLGCKSSSGAEGDGGSPGPSSTASTKPGVPGGPAGHRQGGKPIVARPSADADQGPTPPANSPIPALVKTEGYVYSGLDYTKAMNVKRTMKGKSTTGTSTTSLVMANAGKAVFKEEFGGDLADIPTGEVTATSKGVFETSLFGHTLSEPQLELPADPKPGYTWHTHVKYKGPADQDLEENTSHKIIGFDKVKIGGNTYDALVAVDQGSVRVDKRKGTTSEKRWMVKGYGIVRLDSDTKWPEGSEKITLVATSLS